MKEYTKFPSMHWQLRLDMILLKYRIKGEKEIAITKVTKATLQKLESRGWELRLR